MESLPSVTAPTSDSVEKSLKPICITCIGTSLSLPALTLAIDQKVVAKWWQNGSWYAATIRKVLPMKAYVQFYDGYDCSVSVQNILPLVSAWQMYRI